MTLAIVIDFLHNVKWQRHETCLKEHLPVLMKAHFIEKSAAGPHQHTGFSRFRDYQAQP